MIENLTEKEIAALKGTKNETEWNNTCDDIKRARGNQYPPDWYKTVLATGLMGQIQESWGTYRI